MREEAKVKEQTEKRVQFWAWAIVALFSTAGWVYNLGGGAAVQAHQLSELDQRVTVLEKNRAQDSQLLHEISDKLDDVCDHMGIPRRR